MLLALDGGGCACSAKRVDKQLRSQISKQRPQSESLSLCMQQTK